MAAKYYVTLTDFGAMQIAQAHDVASITLSELVLGDANGIPYDPITQKSRTALINQRASVPVQSVEINGAVTTVTATIEANIGGFNLHEIGLKDNAGKLIYIGNYHGAYKPVIAEGAGGELTISIDITTESGRDALISIDPNMVTANKDWVIKNFATILALKQLKELMENADTDTRQQLSEAVEALQLQLSNLANGLESLYPKVILSGVIKQGDAPVIYRPENSNINFLDARYAIHITPEGGHEAWSIVRQDTRVDLNVFNRSGTNRIGYNGIINWSIVQVEGLTSTTGNGTYVYTGTPVVFPILSGESKAFTIIGAGGGGGSSRYIDLNENPTPPELKGQNGQDSYISIDGTTIKFTAGGGKGGVGGVVGDGGQKIDGLAGEGGKYLLEGEFTSANRHEGEMGSATAEDHTGASSDMESRGAGGDGADGSLDPAIGFGGGAGEGAKITMVYTNNTTETQYIRLYVGKGGTGERSLITADSTPDQYVAGEDGSHGFIRVASAI